MKITVITSITINKRAERGKTVRGQRVVPGQDTKMSFLVDVGAPPALGHFFVRTYRHERRSNDHFWDNIASIKRVRTFLCRAERQNSVPKKLKAFHKVMKINSLSTCYKGQFCVRVLKWWFYGGCQSRAPCSRRVPPISRRRCIGSQLS